MFFCQAGKADIGCHCKFQKQYVGFRECQLIGSTGITGDHCKRRRLLTLNLACPIRVGSSYSMPDPFSAKPHANNFLRKQDELLETHMPHNTAYWQHARPSYAVSGISITLSRRIMSREPCLRSKILARYTLQIMTWYE